ncbi:MAG: 2,3-bisphosphoglycerate-dependent phosphoglycerate mutase [Proteobacteria bacterium]|nr:2,3-bisphosphoglycerate-dependent phosphoglycerate mutase [Pseudomonadota bacterium]
MMSYLVLLRHGESQWNKENRFTGFTDVDLNETGMAEAKRAGRLLKGVKFDTVYSSTLRRAYKTAEIALSEMGQSSLPIIKDDALRERDYGDLTGLNKDETRKKFGEGQVHIWRRSYDVPPPGGESLKDVVARVKPYFVKHILPDLQAGKNVLLAAHGNTLRAMLIILGEYTPETINSAEIATGVPSMFEYKNGKLERCNYDQGKTRHSPPRAN